MSTKTSTITKKLEQNIADNCTAIDIEERYDEMLDESYGKIDICGCSFIASYALKRLDPTAYRCGMSDFESNEGFIEIGGEYYELADCQVHRGDLTNDLECDLSNAEDELEELSEEAGEMSENEETIRSMDEKNAEIASLRAQIVEIGKHSF